MNFAAAITLYNPTMDQIARCKEYAHSFERVYILDNSEKEDESVKSTFELDCFTYIKMNGNEGLPKAFNCVLDSDLVNSFDYLCTLDQDSIYSFTEIAGMKSFIKHNCRNNEFSRVVIYAPVIDYGRGVKKIVDMNLKKKLLLQDLF